MGHCLTLNKFLLLAPFLCSSLLWAGTDYQSQAQSDWEFLREASKEVELYLPNEAIVNQDELSHGQQTGEIVDEVGLKMAAPKRSQQGAALRQRSLAPEVAPAQEATSKGPKLSPEGLRFRSR